MLKNLPKEIVKYLVEELPPFTGLLLVKTDENGIVRGYYGQYLDYFTEEPKVGNSIHDYSPALFSMIPPLVSPMVLNNIKSTTQNYADIHIIESSVNDYWVIFMDQTNEVEKIRDILQQINSKKLKLESGKIKPEKSLFNVFEHLQLKVLGEKIGMIESPIPLWFKSLNPTHKEGDSIVYTETFPYLEVFEYEAIEFWGWQNNGKLKSGIWTETTSDGREITLNAYAIYYNDEKYLLVQEVDEGLDGTQMALQMARDQKLAYEKLEKAERKLKTLLEYKDKFVSIVSHDLRSPVAAVLGIAELLLNDKEEIEKLSDFNKDMLVSIKEEMLRLLDYNDKLYHWSNLELGNFEIVRGKSSLLKLIEAASRTADQKMKAKNISFSTNLKDKILTVNVDTTLFLQVVNNLMANAIKFTPENGNISIDVKQEKNKLEIAVVDSGVGMTEEISKNIFKGFARSSTMGTGGEKGTGLGLGIVKKIIDAHGFEIRVESEPGKGSSFIIVIDD
ncbi:MAG: hypothetical protein C0595_12730 [Marinilabiliales bacterium]|nr:MAG: hypothetical protein C0595_12730 [Marinilabiliales bacterium]